MNIEVLKVVKEYIENELERYVKQLNLEKRCLATQANGKRCKNKVKDHNKNVCKKHENCTVVQERKNFSCVLYHNHLPNEKSLDCPRCLVKHAAYYSN
jgi:hypothetical protein